MSNRHIDHNGGCLGHNTAADGLLLYAEQINYTSSIQFYYWDKCDKEQVTSDLPTQKRVAVFKLKPKNNE